MIKAEKNTHLLKKGNPTIPKKVTPRVAEFLGIMLGDGCAQAKSNQITISCGDIDMPYITKYIPKLVLELFSKKVSFRKVAQGSIDCCFASKEVCSYLYEKFNFQSPKIDCEIPELFFKNKTLLRACIRGLIDTDGGIYKHHKNSIQLSFTNKCLPLINSLRNYLGF